MKKTHIRTVTLILIAALFTALFTGCGLIATSDSKSETVSTATENETTDVSNKKATEALAASSKLMELNEFIRGTSNLKIRFNNKDNSKQLTDAVEETTAEAEVVVEAQPESTEEVQTEEYYDEYSESEAEAAYEESEQYYTCSSQRVSLRLLTESDWIPERWTVTEATKVDESFIEKYKAIYDACKANVDGTVALKYSYGLQDYLVEYMGKMTGDYDVFNRNTIERTYEDGFHYYTFIVRSSDANAALQEQTEWPRIYEENIQLTAGMYQTIYNWVVDAGVYDGMDCYEAVNRMANYVCDRCYYDNSLTLEYAYNMLETNSGICNAYAELFREMCRTCGIECVEEIGGTDIGYHGWNRLVIDGQNYWIDVTWMDCFSRDTYGLSEYRFTDHYWNYDDSQYSLYEWE